MSVRAVAYMKELHTCPNGEIVTRTEKLIGIVLGDSHQDRANRRTFPSVDMIAEDGMVSERTCQRVLASLERKGVIRREYPGGIGRGKTTYYFFPALDDKGCHDVTLSEPAKTAKRVTEGCHKGDIRRTAYKEEQEQVQQKQIQPPNPLKGASGVQSFSSVDLANGGVAGMAALERGIEQAIDVVMRGCGFTERRLRRVLEAQLWLEVLEGVLDTTAAPRMIAAWREQQTADTLLRAKYKPRNFFGDGHWRDSRGWLWDRQAIDQLRGARVGMQ